MMELLLKRIAKDEFEVADVPIEAIPALMIKLAAAFTGLMTRLMLERSANACASQDKLLTVEDAARILRITPKTVRKLAREEKLLAFQEKEGSPWYFRPEAIEKYLDRESGVEKATKATTRKRTSATERQVNAVQTSKRAPKPDSVAPFNYLHLQTKDRK